MPLVMISVRSCPARPTKGSPLKIFVAPRTFADKHQLGIRIADAKYHVRSPRMQFTAPAVADVSAKFFESIGLRARWNAGKQIGRRASKQAVIFDAHGFRLWRISFRQKANAGAPAPFEMALERCRQRRQLVRVTDFRHQPNLSWADRTTRPREEAITFCQEK